MHLWQNLQEALKIRLLDHKPSLNEQYASTLHA